MSFARFLRFILLSATYLLLGGCTTVVAGKKATRSGRVLIGHNEDCDTRPARISRIPREEKSADPQGNGREGQTWSRLWAEIPGEEFCDSFLNEWGVAVTSNNAPSKISDMDLFAAEGGLTGKGVGGRLRRAVAERARSAREGVDIAASLLTEYGYAASGRMYTIADRDEAWILHAAAGKQYCAVRLEDDRTAVIPNSYVLGEVDEADAGRFVCSGELAGYAERKGWYDTARGPFRFDRAYGKDGLSINSEKGFDWRQWTGQRILTGKEPPQAPLPLCVKPAKPVTPETVRRILRSHHEYKPQDMIEEELHGGNERAICYEKTRVSLVFQFGGGNEEDILWFAAGRPCGSIYVPFLAGAGGIAGPYGDGRAWEVFDALQSAAESPEAHRRLVRMVEEYEARLDERLYEWKASGRRDVEAFTSGEAERAWHWAKEALRELK